MDNKIPLEDVEYIGPNQIEALTTLTDLKSPLGNDVLMIHYKSTKDKKSGKDTTHPDELMTKKTYEILRSKDPSDYTANRDLKMKNVVRDVLTVMAEYNIRYSEMDNLMQQLVAANNANMDAADEIIYGTDTYNRTMLHIQQVLNQGQDASTGKDNNSGAGGSDQA